MPNCEETDIAREEIGSLKLRSHVKDRPRMFYVEGDSCVLLKVRESCVEGRMYRVARRYSGFQELNDTRFFLTYSEVCTRSEVKESVGSSLELYESCFEGIVLNEGERCGVESLA